MLTFKAPIKDPEGGEKEELETFISISEHTKKLSFFLLTK